MSPLLSYVTRSNNKSQLSIYKDIFLTTTTDTKYFISQDSVRKTITHNVFRAGKSFIQVIRYLKIDRVDGGVKGQERMFLPLRELGGFCQPGQKLQEFTVAAVAVKRCKISSV